MGFFRQGVKIIDKINDTLGSIIALLAIPMMLSVVYEVIVRYLFNSPTIWVMELNQHLLCAYTALAGGYVLLHKAHVGVDILYERFPQKIRILVNLLTALMGGVFLYILFTKSLDIAVEAWVYKEHSDSLFAPYLFPAKITIPIGAFLFFFQLLAKLVRDIEELLSVIKNDAGASSQAGE